MLFLGRDNFVVYELRGSRPFTAVRNYYDPNYVKPDLRLKDVFRKFDFDSVTPRTLARFPFVITTRAAYASGPPAGLRAAARDLGLRALEAHGTGGRAAHARRGRPTRAPARLLGARADARVAAAAAATVFAAPPGDRRRMVAEPHGRERLRVVAGADLPAGAWEISLQYDATRPVHVSAPGLDATLPGQPRLPRARCPYYAVGELAVRHRRPDPVHGQRRAPAAGGPPAGTKSVAHLGAIAASPAGRGGPIPGEAERRIPLSRGCGRYVDWYRPPAGAEPNISRSWRSGSAMPC